MLENFYKKQTELASVNICSGNVILWSLSNQENRNVMSDLFYVSKKRNACKPKI